MEDFPFEEMYRVIIENRQDSLNIIPFAPQSQNPAQP